jgi:hypothetical protein
VDRIRLGTDLSLARPWATTHFIEPLSEAVRSFPDREPRRIEVTREWMDEGPKRFELAQVEEADVAVLPIDWELAGTAEYEAATERFLDRAAAAGRTVLTFDHSDAPRHARRPGLIAFMRSLYRSSRRPWELAMPAWIADPFGTGTAVPAPRDRPDVPTVTFCGFVPHLARPAASGPVRLQRAVRGFGRRGLARAGLDERRGFLPPQFHRADALRRLDRSPDVHTEFIVRRVATDHTHREGRRPADASMTPEEYRQQYFDNITAGDYVLAVRGAGNYSVRFYEAMASARIPLFVDTDCVLPLEHQIDWDDLVLRIDARRIRRLDRELLERHEQIDAEEFAARQLGCRRAWIEHLTMAGFFAWLHRGLSAGAADGSLAGADGHARIVRALQATR